MEFIGVYIKLRQNTNYRFKQFFELVKQEAANWVLDEDEIIDQSKKGELLDVEHERHLSTEELQNLFKRQLVVIFARLTRWPIESQISTIDTYLDYAKSNCSLAILCADVYHYEIYSKNEEEIYKMYFRFKKDTNVEILEYITVENNGRQIFHF